MTKAPPIDDLTAEHLLRPVSNMLGQKELGIINWQIEPLKAGAGNPVTLGLHYISGSALTGSTIMEFELVLKMIQSPANLGLDLGGGEDQQHWNYWQREARFYESKLADLFPPGFSAPKFYGLDRWDGRIIWLWMEAVNHYQDVERRVEDLVLLAHHLGRFNGLFTPPNILPPVTWLGTNTHDQWLQPVEAFKNPLLNGRQLNWNHPQLQALFPDPNSPFHRFWDNLPDFLALLTDLPPTWCHGDSAPGNFKIQDNPAGRQVVALDWALSCIGVLGQDIGHLLFGSYHWFPESEWDSLTTTIVNSYLDGLREVGWQGSERQLRLGCAITILVKYAVFAFLIFGVGLNQEPDTPPPPQYHQIARFLDKTAEIALKNK